MALAYSAARLGRGCARPRPATDLRVHGRHCVRLPVLVPGCAALQVDAGQEHGDDLLAGPQRARLEHRGHRHAAVPVLQPHQDVHQHVLLYERVALGEQAAAQQRILHDAHHWLVRLQEKGGGGGGPPAAGGAPGPWGGARRARSSGANGPDPAHNTPPQVAAGMSEIGL
jgi:hypothetical protein